MSDNDVQKKLGQHKKDRVYIRYEPLAGSGQKVELPMVVGVMANLSGHKSTEDRGDLSERDFEYLQGGHLDPLMEKLEPTLTLSVPKTLGASDDKPSGTLGVKLSFKSLEDFEPRQVANQVPELAELMKIRTELANLKAYLDGKPSAQKSITGELRNMIKKLGSAA